MAFFFFFSINLKKRKVTFNRFLHVINIVLVSFYASIWNKGYLGQQGHVIFTSVAERFRIKFPNLSPRVVSLASRKNPGCGWSRGNVCHVQRW